MAERVEIPGSEREADPQHERVGEVDRDKPIEVTVYLRPSGSLDWVDQEAGRAPSRAADDVAGGACRVATGASDEDIAAVRSFAGEYGLEVTARRQGTPSRVVARHGAGGRRSVRCAGAAAVRAPDRGAVPRPERTSDGSERARGRDHRSLRDRRTPAGAGAPAQECGAAAQSYTPPEVAAAYNFPSGVNGSGQTAAILELGGGFSQTDLDTYFKSLGLTSPSVSAVSVDGGTNSPGTDPNADGEVMLDIEVLGLRRAGRQDRRLLRAEYRPGLHRRALDRRARRHEQAVGRLDQLGRSGGFLDAAGADPDGTDPHRRSRGRRDGHRGVG